MEKIAYQEPWPDWEEVIILWDNIHKPPSYPIREILNWIESAPGGKYHLHGYKSTEGFAFRFERPEDATFFRLRWL